MAVERINFCVCDSQKESAIKCLLHVGLADFFLFLFDQVRFHYGHPDVFDRMSAITLGGISKACKGIHLSEDIFAGFNYVLRGGESTQADYIQV